MNNINPKIFDNDVEEVPIRKGFGEGLLLAGEQNENVVGLCADLTESTQMNLFKEKFENRFFEMGVAEQNMASVASGMAAMGKVPFISSYGVFSPGRNWEQIRTNVCYNNSNVKIAGNHTGVSVGPDGGSHQALEDIALMRVLPHMTVISPCDAIEARKATLAAATMMGPVYIRLAREKTPIITTEETPFEVGKSTVFFESKEKATIAIIATGALAYQSIVAAKQLEEEGVNVTVLNLATIKPLDEESILRIAKEVKGIVTVEEHQINGGMGSAIAEFLSENYPIKIIRIGVKDQFGQSGTPLELIKHYGMSTEDIVQAVRKIS